MMDASPAMNSGHGIPLGAHCDEDGVSFAMFSEHAERVELCLFDPASGQETSRVDLARKPDGTWSEHLTGLGEGAHYGYRVHGPWEPEAGYRFNPNKLLLDPYARQFTGEITLAPEHYAYPRGGKQEDLGYDERDSAPVMPRCVVTAVPGPGPAALADIPGDRVIYEAHVRGMTMRHAGLPEDLRGRFAGMADQRVIEHLKALGITTVELLPVQYFVDEQHLQQKGLRNYWGYNSLGFFAPSTRYGDAHCFRALVERLHEAGLEVVLDVVYNHTGEGDHLGPQLCFRGLDNLSYYRLQPENPRYYVNDTGCGNTLDLAHPRVRALVLDSLRFWVETLGVDGFRFDLATALARDGKDGGFRSDSAFFSEIAADPLLSQRLLIAEPWDIGPDGYQLGNFPAGWCEWNDRYRDTVRRFWRGEQGLLPELARSLHGSGDIFEGSGRAPAASINFVTSHDGFTLADLVSYENKHNEANGENNRDGHAHNHSANCGAEGATDDERILALRVRQRRNLMATLLLSEGTPMILMGDELGHSQQGNNNAYCQDSPLTWFDWSASASPESEFLAFLQYVIGLRRRFPLLAWPDYIHDADETPRCRWYGADGSPMDRAGWHNEHRAWLGKMLSGEAQAPLLLLLNASARNIPFRLPIEVPRGMVWKALLDTANRDYTGGLVEHSPGGSLLLRQRSVCLLTVVEKDE